MPLHFPLIDKDLLASLRLIHAGFNIVVVLLFLYQAKNGMTIRRARLARSPLPFPAIKRHRKGGPFFASLALVGFLFGLVLVLLHTGNILEYPPHFFTGFLVMLALAVTFFISKRIKGQSSSSRKPHLISGVALLVLFLLEVFLGIGVLF